MDLLAQMHTFVRVVDAGSLSSAARGLGLSVPAVSRQLRALEEELGASLLVRSTRHLRVTDAGRAFYDRSVRVLREIDEARHAVRAPHDVRGSLVVSSGVTFGMHLVVPKLPALARAHPHLTVDLRLEERVAELISEGVDVAIRAGVPLPDTTTFTAQPLGKFPRIVVASPGYLRAKGTPRTPDELGSHEAVLQLGALGLASRWTLARGKTTHTLEMRGALRSTTPQALRAFALADAGLALLPPWLVATDLADGSLRRVLDGWESPAVTAWAYYRADARGVARIHALLTALRAKD